MPWKRVSDATAAEIEAVIARQRLKTARDALGALTAEQRLELFGDYCHGCGRDDPTCQCWNDE